MKKARAAMKAREEGFANAYSFVGGVDAWTENDGPVEANVG